MKTVGASLKAELQSGVPVIATCWKIERVDGTVLGFTDWVEPFDYLGTTYNSSGGYERTALNQKDGLSVDNMDVIGVIDDAHISDTDLLAGKYRGAKVWIFAVSPGNLGWGDMKLDHGVIGEVHVGELHFVAEFRSLVTLLSQEFGSKFSRYCRHELGESKLVSGVEMKCGIELRPATWLEATAYSVNDVVMPGTLNGKRFVCTTAGTSVDNSDAKYEDLIGLTGPVSHWRLSDQVVDANWSNVKLLLHCDGANAGTTFTDSSSSGKTITAGGNTVTDTSQKVFGTSSARIQGTDDYLSAPYHASDWDFNSKAWTLEFWYRRVSQPQTNGFIIGWTDAGGYGWRVLSNAGSGGYLYMQAGLTMGSTWSGGAGSAPLDTWVHVAICGGSSGNIDVYINGSRTATGSGFVHSVPTTDPLYIGASSGTVWESDMYIDDIRITTGTKRYSGTTCPVPDAPYQHSPARAFDFYGDSHLTMVNTPVFESTAIIPSGDGTCADFQSADTDSFSSTATDLDNLFATGGSVIAWLKVDTGSTGLHIIASKDGGTASATDNYGGWALYYDADNQKISYYHRYADGVSVVSNGRWHTPNLSALLNTVYHVALVHDASDADNDPLIYINGVSQTLNEDLTPTSTHNTKSDADSTFYLGQRDTSQGSSAVPINGLLQDVVVYDKEITSGDVISNYQGGQGNVEPAWNTTNGAITPDGPVRWTTYDAYLYEGAATSVTSRFVFTASALTEPNGKFQYGVLTWLTGANAGTKHDIKKSTSGGEITLRRATAFDIGIGDTFDLTVGCNHILKMPGDSKGSPYTGDCKAKFNLEIGGNQKHFGGEPEMPNIDRIAAPAGSV